MNVTKKERLISVFLISLLILLIPMQSYATTKFADVTPQVYDYTDPTSGMRIIATVYSEDNIRVDAMWENESATTVVIGDSFYVNGEYMENEIVEDLALGFLDLNDSGAIAEPNAVDTSGVKWGSWTIKTKAFYVYKLAIGTICTMVVGYILSQGITFVSFAESTLIAAVGTAVTLGYDYFKVEAKYRIGYNSKTKYNFAQQSYTYYGKYEEQSYVKIKGPVVTTQKKADK